LIGEIGLIALILEAGIELDVAQLRQTGTRAMAIAFTGSLLPVAVGIGISVATGYDFKAALAIGASFAPTSLGVAASALGGGGMINTPVGQLIIAACVVDDIIGLVLLSMFKVLVKEDPQLYEYFIPLISSFGFLIVLGVPAVTFLPRMIETKYLPVFPKKWRSLAMFALLTAMCMAYLPLLNYTQSSYLTGAFLAGATFSQIDGAYDTFTHSAHSIMEWLLRVFFAATIGFQVPLKEFKSQYVIGMGFVLWGTCVVIKSLVAFFVPRFEKVEKGAIYNPYKRDLLVTGLSMTCRGEFSFIIAAFALSEGIIAPDIYAAVVFAVLLSAITSPFILLQCIAHFKQLQKKHLEATNPMKKGGGDGTMPLHFYIHIETKAGWSLFERLQNEVRDLDLVVDDLRTRHTRGLNPTINNDVYVRDKNTRVAIPTLKIQQSNHAAFERVSNMHSELSQQDLVSAISTNSLGALEKSNEEGLEDVDILSKQLKEEQIIEAREKQIQETLYRKLSDLGITVLDVEQWNPWDWTSALDTMVLKRSNGELADMKFFMDLFDQADTDGSGDVDGDELFEVLTQAGLSVTKEGIHTMIAHVDEDGDGDISRVEWEACMMHYLEQKKNSKKTSLIGLLGSAEENNDPDSKSDDNASFPIKMTSLMTSDEYFVDISDKV